MSGSSEASHSSSNNNHKKAKMAEAWRVDFDALRKHILDFPVVAQSTSTGTSSTAVMVENHPAVAAALKGLDQEVSRRMRDEKLKKKFAAAAMDSNALITATAPAASNVQTDESALGMDAVKIEKPQTDMTTEQQPSDMCDDWQDVTVDATSAEETSSKDQTMNDDSSTSYLGSLLAKQAVTAMSQRNVRCQTPEAALLVALHASMLQTGFVCTGLPANAKGPSNGLAAPVRALPASQFIPKDYESVLQLRYRKNGTGAIVLCLSRDSSTTSPANSQVEVVLTNASSKEPISNHCLRFPLSEHINLDSWSRAKKDSPSVAPALHYKALSTLLTRFVQHFDLGVIGDESTAGSTIAAAVYVDHTMLQKQDPLKINQTTVRPLQHGTQTTTSTFPTQPAGMHPPNRAIPVGPYHCDFSGDLTPTGIQPMPGSVFPGTPGNLMGPDHPMFNGGIVSGGIVPGGGLGMQPRFDPFGPPGGPMQPGDPRPLHQQQQSGRRPRFPAGGSGNPNNDLHQPPPSFGGNNMFL